MQRINGNLSQHEANFANIAGFPGVWGCIDGTHIEVSVDRTHRLMFYNRKHKYTLNIQVTVGPQMQILDLVNGYPGSFHDAQIFKDSALFSTLRNNPVGFGHLLADGGYALETFAMTPFRRTALTSEARKAYNKKHAQTRNVIERMFGMWKSKFQVLNYRMTVKLEKAMNVITACAVLWNFLLAENEIESPEEEDENPDSDYEEIENAVHEAGAGGITLAEYKRNNICGLFA